MSNTPLPTRPRLADHVSSRRHFARNEEVWVLYDERSGLAYRLGAREWGLLAHADGTRDLEGIVAAAARNGTFARVPLLQTFLEALHQAKLLADGVENPPEAPPSAPTRPLDPLPDFRLVCDGLGSCCRLYSTVMFRPVEEAVARSLQPRIAEAGDHPERLFAPLIGSAPCGASSVGFVDGQCAYLGARGRCLLHAAGGPQGKPLGCRTFPALYVDDGQTIRVAPAVECACVLESLENKPDGELLVPNHQTSSADLDPGIHIARLPDMILITKKRYAARDELVAWSHVITRSPATNDTLGAFLALAEEVEQWGLDLHAARRAMTSTYQPPAKALQPSLFALVERTKKRLDIDQTWRSENDLALRSLRWIARAAEHLTLDPANLDAMLKSSVSTNQARSEAFYLRAGAHGHHFVLSDAPLAQALRERAMRIGLSRTFSHIISPDELHDEPVLRHPLALVEATLRALL